MKEFRVYVSQLGNAKEAQASNYRQPDDRTYSTFEEAKKRASMLEKENEDIIATILENVDGKETRLAFSERLTKSLPIDIQPGTLYWPSEIIQLDALADIFSLMLLTLKKE